MCCSWSTGRPVSVSRFFLRSLCALVSRSGGEGGLALRSRRVVKRCAFPRITCVEHSVRLPWRGQLPRPHTLRACNFLARFCNKVNTLCAARARRRVHTSRTWREEMPRQTARISTNQAPAEKFCLNRLRRLRKPHPRRSQHPPLYRRGLSLHTALVLLYIPPHTLPVATAGTSVIYQPAAAAVNTRGGSFRAVGGGSSHDLREGARQLEAGLCVRVDDSAWSRPLNIAVQGAGGPFQVRTTGFPLYAW